MASGNKPPNEPKFSVGKIVNADIAAYILSHLLACADNVDVNLGRYNWAGKVTGRHLFFCPRDSNRDTGTENRLVTLL